MPEISINVWAVVASGLAAFMIGGLWYGPLFGDTWLTAHGTLGQKISPVAFVVGAVSYLGLALALGTILNWTNDAGIATGMVLGFVLWLAISFGLGLNVALFSGRPLITFWIDTGYQLLVFVGMGAMLGAWR